jgi:hypothetical protein
VNPFAFAEIASPTPIDWRSVLDPVALVAGFTGMPLERLIDPAWSVALTRQLLAPYLGAPPSCPATASGPGWQGDVPGAVSWRPAGPWAPRGIDVRAPMQGVVGDCYLVASLAALAWSAPHLLDPDRPGARVVRAGPGLEVVLGAGRVPVPAEVPTYCGRMLFARGTDGSAWPARIEAAFARWLLQDRTGRPDLRRLEASVMPPAPAPFDCCPLGLLTGWRTETWEGIDAEASWRVLAALCPPPEGIARHPAALATGMGLDALEAGLVPNHAYTLFGIHREGDRRWVVLRNPWAHFPPHGPAALGAWHSLGGDGAGAAPWEALAPRLRFVQAAFSG